LTQKLCNKNHNNINLLHLIVAPQLSGGCWHNCSTKASQAGHADEQSYLFSYVYGKSQYSSYLKCHIGAYIYFISAAALLA